MFLSTRPYKGCVHVDVTYISYLLSGVPSASELITAHTKLQQERRKRKWEWRPLPVQQMSGCPLTYEITVRLSLSLTRISVCMCVAIHCQTHFLICSICADTDVASFSRVSPAICPQKSASCIFSTAAYGGRCYLASSTYMSLQRPTISQGHCDWSRRHAVLSWQRAR